MAAKNKEKSVARHLYVEQGKTAKEVAAHAAVNVSEKTLGEWVKEGGWKAEREARINSSSQRTEDIKKVISNITERRLEIVAERREAMRTGDKPRVADLDIEAVGIADQIAKWNKTLSAMSKENRITLEIYLEVMQEVFKSLQAEDSKLYLQTLDFQERHVQFVAAKLG